MKKLITLFLLLILNLSSVKPENTKTGDLGLKALIKTIKKVTPEDNQLKEKLKPLLFEPNPKNLPDSIHQQNSKEKIQKELIKNYNATEHTLTSKDGYELSALFVKNENAPVNIIFLTGYFHQYTPTKEWCAPFLEILKLKKQKPNFLMFDWAGYGESPGENRFLRKNAFGSNAYKQVQAAIDFVRKDNDKPIILHGFCFGAAMAMHTTLKAQEENNIMPDALVLSSIFPDFNTILKQAVNHKNNWFYKQILSWGLGKGCLDYMMNGSMFLKPIEMVQKIDIPCMFDHYMYDPFARMDEGLKVFNKGDLEKNMLLISEVGKHVRIHTTAPYQYQQAYNCFLQKCGFID